MNENFQKIKLLKERINELKTALENAEESVILEKFEKHLDQTMDRIERFDLLCIESDEGSDDRSNYELSTSDAEDIKKLKYDLDTQFEIMDKRDNHGWSLKTIHHRWNT